MNYRRQIKDSVHRKTPQIVGAIASLEPLSFPISPNECDIVELRLDSLGYGPQVLDFAKNSPLPLLITARGAAEGGQSDWSIDSRKAAYLALMPFASLIDIELRDFDTLSEVIEEAQKSDVLLIGSHHDFEKTPPLEALTTHHYPKIDILKLAFMTHSINDIKSHLDLIESPPHKNLSLMGMGPLGAAGRPLMAKAGSILNYGYLGTTPTAPNQWPAALLKKALSV